MERDDQDVAALVIAEWHRWAVPDTALATATANVARQEQAAHLVAAYSGPDRHYHTLRHIEQLLQLMAVHANCIADPQAFALAVILHDIVYDATRTDNEAASAALAQKWLTQLGFSAAAVDRTVRLILATDHKSPPADADACLLVDLDLAILASAPVDYAAYAAAIRREYGHVADAAYAQGRARVLSAFLARPVLFTTPALAAMWTEPARQNLHDEIAALTRAA